tara:strand:- start:846 stop:1118 length:273 start_codon:yes stop_codon:yes gene_type:complete
MPDDQQATETPPRAIWPRLVLAGIALALVFLQERQAWPVDASQPDLLIAIMENRNWLIGACLAALVGDTPPVRQAAKAIGKRVPIIRDII